MRKKDRPRTLFMAIALMTASATLATSAHAAASSAPRAVDYKLDNGMEVVVIPDHRAPVIQHMVWYRVGSSDEERGKSGIAHFLEHLMFKGTEKIGNGQFSKIIARNGGQDNAFTTNDSTAYFQAVAKDRLELVMSMEADRMANLKLDPHQVETERNVILEERRSRIDNDPSAQLDEQIHAAMYQNHPYHMPVIGWFHEMETLNREDAFKYYHRYYAPNNAILVVAGDVEPADVLKLAEETYGKLPANPAALRVARPTEPPAVAPRRVEMVDERAGQATLSRQYPAPCYAHAAPREAEALDLLVKVLAGGSTSRMYRQLVVDQKIASSFEGGYSGEALDSGRVALYGVAADGVKLADLEAAMDKVIADVVTNGVTPKELEIARNQYIASYVYESDGIGALARRYGWGLVNGQSIADIEDWPNRLKTVTADDVKRVAEKYLTGKASVTGWLQPPPDAPAGGGVVPFQGGDLQ
jgi:zinc protease